MLAPPFVFSLEVELVGLVGEELVFEYLALGLAFSDHLLAQIHEEKQHLVLRVANLQIHWAYH